MANMKELNPCSRGGGLRTQAGDILRNASSRKEAIEKVARLLSEIDNKQIVIESQQRQIDKLTSALKSAHDAFINEHEGYVDSKVFVRIEAALKGDKLNETEA
jgi:hypothetical protein